MNQNDAQPRVSGIGLDLCGIGRMETLVNDARFLERYFTEEERAYLASKGRNAAQSAAAVYAAKEAFLKAAGIGIGGGISLREIGVVHDENGAPGYHLTGKAEEFLQKRGLSALLSLSHEAGLAAAICILT